MPEMLFGTDQILWFDNGRWGKAGYAFPNPGCNWQGQQPVGGKLWTSNTTINKLFMMLAKTTFELMHREDVRFSRPPNIKFLWDLHRMIQVGLQRLNTRATDFNEEEFRSTHATPAPTIFTVFPVPFFGNRIRQMDIKEWCEILLLCQSEIMQHSDNDKSMEISDPFAHMVSKYLKRIYYLMATTYFGYSKEEASADTFVIPDTRFTNDPDQGYNPARLFLSSELTEERPPLQSWPTETDLTGIRGIPINQALLFGRKWPDLDAAFEGIEGDPSSGITYGTSVTRVAASGAATPGGNFIPEPGGLPRL